MNFTKPLRIASLPKFEIVDKNGSSLEKIRIFDYEEKFMKLLAETLGFTFKIVCPTDGEYGRLRDDGNWTGMVKMVKENAADLIVRRLTITEERKTVIDFSYPYYVDHIVYATRSFERTTYDDSFLKPFSAGVWVSIAFCVLMVPAILSVLRHKKGWLRHVFSSKSFLKLHVRRGDDSGEYIIRMCWYIGKSFLCWSYTAVLLSFLTFPTLTGIKSVSQLAEAVAKETYECTTAPGSYLPSAMLKTSNSELKTIGRSLKSNPGTFDFERALWNETSPKKTAVIESEINLGSMAMRYFVSREAIFPTLNSIGINKNFCCKAQLDSIIHYIWASGIYVKLMRDEQTKNILKSFSASSRKINVGTQISLSVQDLEGIFLLLAAGYLLAIILLVLEITISKF